MKVETQKQMRYDENKNVIFLKKNPTFSVSPTFPDFLEISKLRFVNSN